MCLMSIPRRKLAATLAAAVALLGAGLAAYLYSGPRALVLTGIVTTNDVLVSPQTAGQLAQLLVKEGDTVKKGQLLALIDPRELQADTAYYAHSAEAQTSQVREAEAALRFQERQTADQISQAESTLASAEAQEKASAADLESARLTYERSRSLSGQGVVSTQDLDQARTAWEASASALCA